MPKKGIAALNKKRKSKFNEKQYVQQVLQSGLNSRVAVSNGNVYNS